MKHLVLIVLFQLVSPFSFSQDKSVDEFFAEFMKPDVKPPSPGQPATLPETEEMLKKWVSFEKTKREALAESILAARRIAGEILSKKALSSSAADREKLVAESARIQNLKPTDTLTMIQARGGENLAALTGLWKKADGWSHEYSADGRMKHLNGIRDHWHWVDDSTAVAVLVGSDFEELLWLEKPGKLQVVGAPKGNRDTYNKTSTPPASRLEPVIVKLAADESAQRLSLNKTLDVMRSKVVAWLVAKAKSLPFADQTALLEKIRQLDAAADEQSGGAALLSGVWRWEKVELAFKPHGIVASKSGGKIGTWCWIRPEKPRNFAVVLADGRDPKQVFIAVKPANRTENSIKVFRMSEGSFTATRGE